MNLNALLFTTVVIGIFLLVVGCIVFEIKNEPHVAMLGIVLFWGGIILLLLLNINCLTCPAF